MTNTKSSDAECSITTQPLSNQEEIHTIIQTPITTSQILEYTDKDTLFDKLYDFPEDITIEEGKILLNYIFNDFSTDSEPLHSICKIIRQCSFSEDILKIIQDNTIACYRYTYPHMTEEGPIFIKINIDSVEEGKGIFFNESTGDIITLPLFKNFGDSQVNYYGVAHHLNGDSFLYAFDKKEYTLYRILSDKGSMEVGGETFTLLGNPFGYYDLLNVVTKEVIELSFYSFYYNKKDDIYYLFFDKEEKFYIEFDGINFSSVLEIENEKGTFGAGNYFNSKYKVN